MTPSPVFSLCSSLKSRPPRPTATLDSHSHKFFSRCAAVWRNHWAEKKWWRRLRRQEAESRAQKTETKQGTRKQSQRDQNETPENRTLDRNPETWMTSRYQGKGYRPRGVWISSRFLPTGQIFLAEDKTRTRGRNKELKQQTRNRFTLKLQHKSRTYVKVRRGQFPRLSENTRLMIRGSLLLTVCFVCLFLWKCCVLNVWIFWLKPAIGVIVSRHRSLQSSSGYVSGITSIAIDTTCLYTHKYAEQVI